MAGGSNTHTTVSNLQKTYRKSATKMYKAFKASNEEWNWFDDVPDEEITPSGRENLIPLDVRRGYGASMITDGGNEAVTVTPDMEEGTFSFVHCNARFFISLFAQAFDRKARSAQIIRQLRYQSMKCFESVSRRFSLQTYGFSTGVVALVSGDPGGSAASHTITIDDAFGMSAFDNAAYLGSLFQVGDRVALIRSSALVTNALGVITAVTPATPSIAVTWDGSVDPADNDQIVFANTVTDATITATDFNRWPVGFFDAATSASVHSLATSTAAAWAAGYADVAGGRMSAVRLKKLRQGLMNNGDGTLTDIILANGVENDWEAGERAARIFTNATFDLDGSLKSKGVTWHTSAQVPPGSLIGWDRDGYAKKVLTDMPAEDGLIDFGDLYKAEDRSGLKGGLDLIYARIVRSRAKIGYFTGLSEQ